MVHSSTLNHINELHVHTELLSVGEVSTSLDEVSAALENLLMLAAKMWILQYNCLLLLLVIDLDSKLLLTT